MTNRYMNALDDFPDIKLSYDTLMHKKVLNADVILAIPQGKKCYAWFTTRGSNYVCYLLELGQKNKVEKVHLRPACFSKELSYGSIFYGTMFLNNNMQFVVFEDVFHYKGKNVSREKYIDKLDIMHDVFTNHLKNIDEKNVVRFGLPPMHTNHEDLVKLVSPRQRIMYFQYRHYQKHTTYRVKPHVVLKPSEEEPVFTKPHNHKSNPMTKQPNIMKSMKNARIIEQIFFVTASIDTDIYFLRKPDDSNDSSLVPEVAYIPDFKTSVMMNTLFRNIKENQNLDALEESDDEDEFEDERDDKFVDLTKEFEMVCTFHHKFKKWVPVRLANK